MQVETGSTVALQYKEPSPSGDRKVGLLLEACHLHVTLHGKVAAYIINWHDGLHSFVLAGFATAIAGASFGWLNLLPCSHMHAT